MANNQRSFIRKIFPTAHQIMLRRLVDPLLRSMRGDVLIIGAGKEPYRTLIRQASSLCCTDIEHHEGIDCVADAHDLPFLSDSFDVCVAIEVLEHLQAPHRAAAEITRVLRSKGSALVTIPFMFHVHGDPFDYQRFTSWGLEKLFHSFGEIHIVPFGNRIQVTSDLLTTCFRPAAALRVINHLLALKVFSKSSIDSPSGYIVKLQK